MAKRGFMEFGQSVTDIGPPGNVCGYSLGLSAELMSGSCRKTMGLTPHLFSGHFPYGFRRGVLTLFAHRRAMAISSAGSSNPHLLGGHRPTSFLPRLFGVPASAGFVVTPAAIFSTMFSRPFRVLTLIVRSRDKTDVPTGKFSGIQ